MMLRNGPCCSLQAMIRAALLSPIPGRVISSQPVSLQISIMAFLSVADTLGIAMYILLTSRSFTA